MTQTEIITVPMLDETLEPPTPDRVRALKKHLIESSRAARLVRRSEPSVRKVRSPPMGFVATVLEAGCATCRGHCCKGGGNHAYIDDTTIDRVRRDHPALDARAIIDLYLKRVAPVSCRDSCLFHGRGGCGLDRALRADLCNDYYCNGLQDFIKRDSVPDRVQILATRNGRQRRSRILARAESGQ